MIDEEWLDGLYKLTNLYDFLEMNEEKVFEMIRLARLGIALERNAYKAQDCDK